MVRRFDIRFDEPVPVPSPDAVVQSFARPPGLYVHIPFCRRLCPFCPYNKVVYRTGLAARYLEALEREADLYLEACPGPFSSLYVGGGTPTLCLDEMEGLLARLPVAGERAIEVLPIHLTADRAARLADFGFDYVSLGVQSFDREVLRRLRRPGSPARNRAAIEHALGKFACVDVDLIFDSAYDDPRIFLADLEECFGYGVDQVSTYPLMRFGYTPFGKGAHSRTREHALLRRATELAAVHGYERRSVWSFNRRGSPRYSSITRPSYLGLGAGAASFTGRVFLVNHFALAPYGDALRSGTLPIARVARLPRFAGAAYRAFWQIYSGTIPFGGDDPLIDYPLSVLIRNTTWLLGWSKWSDGSVVLSDSGYDRYHDLERWVTYHLIEPLWEEMMREHVRPVGAGSEERSR